MPADDSPPPLWQNDESLRDLRRRLASPSHGIRVVSFDFFDTLIHRLCDQPADLFIEVGRRLAAANLLKLPLTPDEFYAARLAADDQARRKAAARGRSPEIVLATIYDELDAVVTDVAAACRLELETERHFCFLNPSIVSLVEHVRALGLRTAVISDTYFTAAELRQFLTDNGGSPALFDALFVSSEAGCAKWDGRLFLKACAHFDIHPNELLHVGDNHHADVTVARQFGVEPVYYHHGTSRQVDTFEAERRLRPPATRPAASLNALRLIAARLTDAEDDPYRDGAFVFGPVLARYADWCVNKFSTSGVRTVLALMREGEILGELVDRAAQAAGAPLKVLPCFVSRLSTARASLREVTLDRIAVLLEGSPTITLHNVVEILGILPEAQALIPRELLHQPVPSVVAMRPLLEKLLEQRRLVELIERRCQEARTLAFAYLDSLTGGETKIGFIDLGWSGSIQRNVTRILRLGGRAVRGVGCYVATTRRAGRLALEGDEAHGYADSEWHRSTLLPEVAINACLGSTNGYARSPAGEVVPVLAEYQVSPDELHRKRRIRDGILAFQTLWLAVRRTKGEQAFTPAMLADFDAQSAAILQRLIEQPGAAEARRLGGLTHDENYWGERYTRALCHAEAEQQLVDHGAGRLFAGFHCHWPQGVVARRYPRLIASLNKQWLEPRSLGRAGCRRNPRGEPTGLTDEERAALLELLRHLAPHQVILASRAGVAMESDFAGLWPDFGAAAKAAPHLISFGDSGRTALWHRRVEGDPAAPSTLRAVRALLQPGARHALVLTGDLSSAETTALLNGLPPFLGPSGAVLASQGDSDLVAAKEHALTKAVTEWFQRAGHELGFDPAASPSPSGLERRNWMVFARGQAARESEDYWQLTLRDLPFGARLGGKLWRAPATATAAGAAFPAISEAR